MTQGEETEVWALVMRGFDRFVRPDFTDEGVEEFTRVARDAVLVRGSDHSITVALLDGLLAGMMDVRDCAHIRLFFVDPAAQRRGVGRALMAHVLRRCVESRPDLHVVTVNASRWAIPVYERLGFEVTAPESELNGIVYTPMAKRLPPAV